MTSVHQAKTGRKAPRWMKVVLVLSVAVNLLIFGAVGARFAFGPPLYGPRGLGAPGMMLIEGRRMLRGLPHERRKALRRVARMHQVELRRHRHGVAKTRAELALLLDSQKLDMATFKAAMIKVQMAESEGYKTVLQLREGFILSLTPKERRKFAGRLLRHYNRGKAANQRPWWRSRRNTP